MAGPVAGCAEPVAAEREGLALRDSIRFSYTRHTLLEGAMAGIKRAAMIVADEPELNFLVITGTGDVFCTGGDMGADNNPDRRWDMFTEA